MKLAAKHLHLNENKTLEWYKIPSPKEEEASRWLQEINNFFLELKPFFERIEMEKVYSGIEFKCTRAMTEKERALALDLQMQKCQEFLREELKYEKLKEARIKKILANESPDSYGGYEGKEFDSQGSLDRVPRATKIKMYESLLKDQPSKLREFVLTNFPDFQEGHSEFVLPIPEHK